MTMSFGLKNDGATYQRAIQSCFKRQLNKNVEAYVDDVVVKTRNSSTLIDDLEETFASLREYRWKLNSNKCVFGVPSGKLLGFITSHHGIEANPDKISAITSMKVPTCIKDIQKLTGAWRLLTDLSRSLENGGSPSSNYSNTKRSSCGLQRWTKPLPSSRTSSEATSPHGSSQRRATTALPHCDYSRVQYCHHR
jgi:hypothetical protein